MHMVVEHCVRVNSVMTQISPLAHCGHAGGGPQSTYAPLELGDVEETVLVAIRDDLAELIAYIFFTALFVQKV